MTDAAVAAAAEGTTPGADPLWYKDAIIYQLHVKSFFDSNDDGVGDFPGLIAKLDYIVSLGVNTLWLLPFYPSPRRDDGYDIAYYEGVHTDYGTLDDARAFIDAAHARGLRVITELVINHTSDQHPWFQRARAAPAGSAERAFYVWADDDQGYGGTRIIFCDTEKSNWSYDAVAGQYYWHRFYAHQPDLNFDNPAVLEAVLGIMHFWLDLGVDGLRLDAVPYLIEREGTSNENLPETHAVLKRIRAEIDAHFPGRMLLAEANMWPEDARQYFGDSDGERGDECHMAFHFPLMPRMYMAIAREDRFPITDIMRQTPDIPSSCQWAIFLRNHDELTLEMVTDSERDYLWQTYAADQRARINLGIRRRLAPLLQRDRRRIELMTSLLLTFPGTPVLYYGDEIGMGDNIHLGDRDGVRTPMQWSIDRNGGFSRGDPGALVLPPIMDAQYGFAAVNVEAQERDQFSLLNWTRRLLGVRGRHAAFGRGTQEFLYPGNRKILAYLREHDGESLLCVANLSRQLQAVELDLSRYEARVPVDLVGGATFPPVGRLPYLLTLPAYGFYAFQLATDAALPTWHAPVPEPLPEYRTLVLRGDDLAGAIAAHQKTLESDIVPGYLQRRRWFAEKDKRITRVSLQTLGALAANRFLFAAALVEFDDGSRTTYQLPLGILWEEGDGGVVPQQNALARVRRGSRLGYLTDAFVLEGFARAALQAIQSEQRAGDLRFIDHRRGDARIDDGLPITWLSVEQSNSALLFDDRALLKLLRKVSPGAHPEVEFGRVLGEAGFANVPPLLGEIALADAGDGSDGETTLAVLQGFVRNQGDGWNWSLDYLRRAIDEWRVADDDARRNEIAAGYAAFAARIGRRLAELHALLALRTEPAFAPEPVDAARVRRLLGDVLEACATAAAIVDRDDAAALPDPARLPRVLEPLAQAAIGSLEMRIHGDFHLGQVLVAVDDVYFVDFEGEPGRALAERRRKASPLRDVAGLLRSFDYAAAFVGSSAAERAHEGAADAETCLRDVVAQARRAFLGDYAQGLAHAERPWIDAARFDAVVRLFTIAKAAYEVAYEAANRPTWLPLATRGLATLLDDAESAG